MFAGPLERSLPPGYFYIIGDDHLSTAIFVTVFFVKFITNTTFFLIYNFSCTNCKNKFSTKNTTNGGLTEFSQYG